MTKNDHRMTKNDHRMTKNDHRMTKNDHRMTKNDGTIERRNFEMSVKCIIFNKTIKRFIMKLKITLSILTVGIMVFILSSVSLAQTKPVNVALFNPIQIFPENNSIAGIRINLIYGKNVSVAGLDWGLINHVGTGGFTGIQWGAVNMCNGNVTGWQNGLVNFSDGNVEGFQWGWFNKGNHVSGFQLGIVNMAESMYGLQIGLLNFISKGGQFPVFPIVNWSF
jgi:hypothetical protein